MIAKCPNCASTRFKPFSYCPDCFIIDDNVEFEIAIPSINYTNRPSSPLLQTKLYHLDNILTKLEQKHKMVFSSEFTESLKNYFINFIDYFYDNRNNHKRHNFPNYQQTINIFCNEFGYAQYAKYFALCKTATTRRKINNIVKAYNSKLRIER
jgi:hypothetical protein